MFTSKPGNLMFPGFVVFPYDLSHKYRGASGINLLPNLKNH